MLKLGYRSFSIRSRVFKLSPQEYVNQVQQEKIENEQFKQTLSQDQLEYNPKILSSHKLTKTRPIPINVELLKYKPLRLPKTHGDEMATLTLRGYDEDNLIRVGEFALRTAYYLGIPMSPLMALKTEKRLYTVIKSPFAQAKTKQNFHRITYKKKLVAYDANPEIIDLWLSYINKNKFSDVEYKATVSSYESLNYHEELKSLQEFNLPDAYEGIEDPVAKKVQELLHSDSFKKHL
ncbi:mitochondrial ribosomal small subunit component, putative [Candida dubliniensis CD36]|uniref:Mitochondrial ribosomal small subunit component, putative n=1 Tax=Candida dubliniensis (strain CD36 / ATCC MYA-646 / CBS 7987 / NCPF 3949 / NRRL Y-17841) TaxID=573826 RepID=B9WEW3_CANDC|nr:mitochondrial 37S ribosomal protein RSM10 [Candida dubliniensis CD36]CAX43226.1 mitochondrial ribosomal small subunit component, putative [Candida dubliniensis CD36]